MSVSYSLAPYSGSWTIAEAGHLLRRTMFGPTHQQLTNAVNVGMAATVNQLMTIPSISKPKTFDPGEKIAGQGATWVTSVYPTNLADVNSTNNARVKSLYAWLMNRINDEIDNVSIVEKLSLFWQNHFGVTKSGDARSNYSFFTLLHSNALGNFKQLVKDVTIHPDMLLFLNGNTNKVQSPNENFARELLELFTIGKGPQIGPGDYTHYTEYDISECAKILTGFGVEGGRSNTHNSVKSKFVVSSHNDTTKTLSSKFDEAVITPNGEKEYEDLIDIIFLQDEVAKFICRKIYRYFVSSTISDEVENKVIKNMANTFRNNNYEVEPVLTMLLSSKHFYDASIRGCLIKGPLDFIFSMWNGTQTKSNFDYNTNNNMYLSMYYSATTNGQSYTEPPSVAGWPAYYQQPSFSQLWLNSSFISQRFIVIDWWVLYKGFNKNDKRLAMEGLEMINSFPNPEDPVKVIDNLVNLFLPKGTTDEQKLTLKSVLTNELPDFEWTIQYEDYVQKPWDQANKDSLIKRIKETLTALFKMPEFHTM